MENGKNLRMKHKTKKELIELVEHYKKLAKINIIKVENKYKILQSLNHKEPDKDLKEHIDNVIKRISEIKVVKPKFYYKFPNRKLTKKDIAEWVEAIETSYYLMKKYEKQERGFSCSVDRAYNNWLIPKCNELLNKIQKLGVLKEK